MDEVIKTINKHKDYSINYSTITEYDLRDKDDNHIAYVETLVSNGNYKRVYEVRVYIDDKEKIIVDTLEIKRILDILPIE